MYADVVIPRLEPIPGPGGEPIFTHENVADLVNGVVSVGWVSTLLVVLLLSIIVFRGRG